MKSAWIVWAGKQTQGFRTKLAAERWAQAVEAFYPRAKVVVTRVRR